MSTALATLALVSSPSRQREASMRRPVTMDTFSAKRCVAMRKRPPERGNTPFDEFVKRRIQTSYGIIDISCLRVQKESVKCNGTGTNRKTTHPRRPIVNKRLVSVVAFPYLTFFIAFHYSISG
jgi:hypothetical protein